MVKLDREKKKAYSKEYYEKNKDKRKLSDKEYYEKNKPQLLARFKAYREKHRDKLIEYGREYRKSNREVLRTYDKIRNAKRKDKIKAYRQKPEVKARINAYRKAPKFKAYLKGYRQRPEFKAKRKVYLARTREHVNLVARKYLESHPQMREHYKDYRKEKRQEFISTYKKGKCCELCGYKEYPEILQFHHKNRKEKSFNIANEYKYFHSTELVKAEIKKCILLCPNCHSWLHFKETRK